MPQSQRISYLFTMPCSPNPRPRSLLPLLHEHGAQLSLEAKLNLAFILRKPIAQLYMMEWDNCSNPYIEDQSQYSIPECMCIKAFDVEMSCLLP